MFIIRNDCRDRARFRSQLPGGQATDGGTAKNGRSLTGGQVDGHNQLQTTAGDRRAVQQRSAGESRGGLESGKLPGSQQPLPPPDLLFRHASDTSPEHVDPISEFL